MSGDHKIVCCSCNIEFWVPDYWFRTKKQDNSIFQCPNGHEQHFTKGPSKLDLVRRERDRLTQSLAEKDDEITRQRELREGAERRVSAAKGQVTRLKNRAKAGVCPCCNRTFKNLARHMHSKHPDFGDDKSNVVPLKDATA